MSLLNTARDNKVTEDVLQRIKQIINDTGYGKIFINIVDHEVKTIEHTITKVFKKKNKERAI
ncbi:MAG: hypothetical protein EHM58_03240 [Ignavibacteriae bacterium]|nr:MAG: hypothetical protein EHM58_03240 [Ignavibacteriota bacterium]